MAKRRFLPNQKTVYDLKLLVIFLKKSVMFFKKLVMFYQSLAALCCFPVYSLIIYKTALDKICLIQDVKGCICKISSAYPLYSCCWEKKNDSLSILDAILSRIWLHKLIEIVSSSNPFRNSSSFSIICSISLITSSKIYAALVFFFMIQQL